MKWVFAFFGKQGGPAAGQPDPADVSSSRALVAPEQSDTSLTDEQRRRSLELWQEARKARASFDSFCSGTTLLTTKLTVELAHGMPIINNVWACLNHSLGTGTYGTVRLVLNLKSSQLYAMKTCSKLHIMQSMQRQLGKRHRLSRAESRRSSADPCAQSVPTAFRNSVRGSRFSGAQAFEEAQRKVGSCGSFSNSVHKAGQTADMLREISVMKTLDHPNIVRLAEVVDDPDTDSLLLLMEYVDGGSLEQQSCGNQHWKAVSEELVVHWVRETLQGLEYLHCSNIIHGDLKPANLLLSSTGRVKVADFGSAVMFSRTSSQEGNTFGTPAYRAPESLQAGYKLSFELDLWALGVCMYVWLYGQLPFEGSSPYAMYENIKTAQPCLPDDVVVSAAACDMLKCLLEKDPSKRLTASQAIQHPWVHQSGRITVPCISSRASFDKPQGQELCRQDYESAIQRSDVRSRVCMGLMEKVFKPRQFKCGEMMFAQGEQVASLLLLAEGCVLCLPSSTGTAFSQGSKAATQHRVDLTADCAASPSLGDEGSYQSQDAAEMALPCTVSGHGSTEYAPSDRDDLPQFMVDSDSLHGTEALSATIHSLDRLSISEHSPKSAASAADWSSQHSPQPLPLDMSAHGSGIPAAACDSQCSPLHTPLDFPCSSAARFLGSSFARETDFTGMPTGLIESCSRFSPVLQVPEWQVPPTMQELPAVLTPQPAAISTKLQSGPEMSNLIAMLMEGDCLGTSSPRQFNQGDVLKYPRRAVAGDVFGVEALFNEDGPSPWPFSGCAMSDVVVLSAPLSEIRRLCLRHPLFQETLASVKCQQQTQTLVEQTQHLLKIRAN